MLHRGRPADRLLDQPRLVGLGITKPREQLRSLRQLHHRPGGPCARRVVARRGDDHVISGEPAVGDRPLVHRRIGPPPPSIHPRTRPPLPPPPAPIPLHTAHPP